MAVKSEATPVEAKVITFPRLMYNLKASGLIVLFTCMNRGTVVSSGVSYPVGHHRIDWIIEGFEDYDGVVTLSNTD